MFEWIDEAGDISSDRWDAIAARLQERAQGELEYSANWTRHSMHSKLVEAFEASGITKRELADRASMKLSRVDLAINVPTNMQIETFGRLMFVLTGKPYEF